MKESKDYTVMDALAVELPEKYGPGRMGKKELLAKVKEVDQDADNPPENSFTADEYAEFTSMSQGNARHHLRQLAKKGKVKVVFKGTKGRVSYALVDEAEQNQRFVG
jgi:DNA-binding transcriptional ArsR family regulator